jgi:hypothetical protein
MGIRCSESGKATGLIEPPMRRVRCVVCNRLLHLRVSPDGAHVIVPRHDFPRMGTYAAQNVLKRLVG